MSRAAVYSRVSRAEQVEGHSLDTQVADAREWASARGVDVAGVYREEGVSGAERSRPELDRLVADAAAGLFDLVLVRHTDRLTRDAGFALELSRQLFALGVDVVAFAEGDATSEESRLVFGVKALVAEEERSRTRERMMRGKAESARQGRWHGGEPPFGTRPVPAPGGRGSVLELDEAEAAAVRDVWSWVVEEGVSPVEAARRLNGRGVVTRRGRRWSHQNLRLLLRSPRLAGRSTSWGVEVDVPAVLTRPQFAALQEALDRGTGRFGAKSGPRDYPLSGRIICGCGAHWTGGFRRGKRWYHCSNHPSYARPGGPVCDWTVRRWIQADQIEGAVRGLLLAELLADGAWSIKSAVLDRLARTAAVDDGEVRRARARVSELEAKYERLLIDDRDEDAVVLRRATASVREDLDAAREQLAAAERDGPSPLGEEWAVLVEETRRAEAGATTMADLAGVAMGELGERSRALAEEVQDLADDLAGRLMAGGLGEMVGGVDLRVPLADLAEGRLRLLGSVYLKEDSLERD